MYSDLYRAMEQTLKFDRILFDSGESLIDYVFNEYAQPVSGFIPVKKSITDQTTMYINVDKIQGFFIADEKQDSIRRILITPKGT